MKKPSFIHFLLVLLFCTWFEVNSTPFYVTPHQSCGSTCEGSIDQPFDNFLFALQKAVTAESPIIIFLANDTVDHYVLQAEQDGSENLLYSLPNPLSFNFTNLEIKPLFCDEVGDLTLPSDTTCTERDETLTIYLKTLRIGIGITSNLTVQNIAFNGREALSDYMKDTAVDYTGCTQQRKMCCQPVVTPPVTPPTTPSKSDPCEVDEDGNINCPETQICYLDQDDNFYCETCYQDIEGNEYCEIDSDSGRLLAGNSYTCNPSNSVGTGIVLESIFRVDDPVNPTSETRQQITFINTHLKSFWGKSIGSFLKARASPYINITFENNTIDDCFFERGLVYIYGESNLYAGGPDSQYSEIMFKNMDFSNYNKWSRYSTTYYTYSGTSFKEGFLLLAEKVFRGTINILESSFSDVKAVSRGCGFLDENSNYGLVYAKINIRTDLGSLCSSRTRGDFLSSLVYIPLMGGSFNVENSTFTRISGIEGSVLRVDQVVEDYNEDWFATTFNFIGSTFESNKATSRFANILITHQNGIPQYCPVVTIKNCKFLNASGCYGGYGNVGLMCQFDSTYVEDAGIFDEVDSPYDLPALITVSDSVFQGNMIAVSNSLAIVGSFSTILERNIFQDNGGTTGEYLLEYSQTRQRIRNVTPTDPDEEPNWDPMTAFGQSTAVYISSFFLLQSNGNTYQGNWGPWQGSQALGSSLTMLKWYNVYEASSHTTTILPITLTNDSFINHVGVPDTIIPPSIAEHLNCYTPPIITLGNNYQNYDDSWGSSPDIIFKGVKFNNNEANYAPITGRCGHMVTDYYSPNRFYSLIDTNMRYRSGLFKFLTPSEQNDHGQLYENDLDPTISNWVGGTDMKFVFQDGEIINNTLINEGCLFPTLRLRYYTLDNLKIEGNQINAAQENQTNATFHKQADASSIIICKAGIFCGFQKNAILDFRKLSLTLKNSNIQNNIGPVINLYPSEYNSLSLSNSTFTNNTCERTATIISSQSSVVTSSNNTFIQNKNAFGIIFQTTPSSNLTDDSSTYIGNTGRYASIFYGDSLATILQTVAKVQGNTISPFYPLFSDHVMPQGGLYFLSQGSLTIRNSNFTENNAYGGFVISSGGTVLFDNIQVVNHSVVGIALLGNFLYGSDLTINNTNMVNNSITPSSEIKIQPSFVKAIVGTIEVSHLTISEVPASNAATMLFGNNVEGDITDITVSNVYVNNGNALLGFTYSEVIIKNFDVNDATPTLYVSDSTLTLNTISIQGIKPIGSSLYMISTQTSTLTISELDYVGGEDRGDYLSLIIGSGNSIMMSDSHYKDAIYGNNKLFDLRESPLFVITGSTFHYTDSENLPLIFSLESSQTVVIESCVFSNTGQLIVDLNTKSNLYFLGNTIIADPDIQKISTTKSNNLHFVNNNFITSADSEEGEPNSNAQIQVIESSGLTKLQHNTFFSLYGYNGIVQIQGITNSYNLTSTGNAFINNIGSLGAALHLDASLSSTSTAHPRASIDSSVFLLNKAIKMEDDTGKGGAIYQTTSTRTRQNTTISKSLFVKNSVDTLGGAIFFDYLPPNVKDTDSKFIENSAGRLNHIGSYAVKLAYYEGQPSTDSVYVPRPVSSRLLQSPGVQRWDDVPSGLTSGKNYSFALVDMFGQVVFSDNSSMLELYPSGLTEDERYLFSNKLSIVAEKGIYTYDNFKFNYKTYASVNVVFRSTAISNRQIPVQPPLNSTNSMMIETHFRGCGRGEYTLTEGTIISCVECQPGFWQTSPNPDAIACDTCDSESTFCLGANKVGPKKDYWRFNETANVIQKCPIDGACLGSEEDLDSQGKCAGKYVGNLCSNCAPGWAKVSGGGCTNCNTDVWYYFRAILVLLVQLLLTVKAIQGTISISKDYSQHQNLNLNGAILIRILTNYLQLLSLIASMPVTWPSVIRNFSSASNQVSSASENVFTLDCLFSSDHLLGTKVIFFKILLTTVGPFALVALGVVCIAIYYKIKKLPVLKNKAFTNLIVATTVVICFMMQPSAIQSGFSLFQCENLYRTDNPLYFLQKDYDVQCWTGAHLYWAIGLGIPILFIWSIGLPLFVFNALRKNKTKLDTPEIAQKYSFLYGGYESENYYWELVIMLRKFILIGVTLGASFHSTNMEIYISIILILFWYFLHGYVLPYSDLRLNRLEQFGLISAGVINFCGLYFKFVPPQPVLDIIAVIFGLIASLLFFVYFALLYFALQVEKLMQNPKVVEILTKIGNKVKFLEPKKIEAFIKKLTTFTEKIAKSKNKHSSSNSKQQSKDVTFEKQKIDSNEEKSLKGGKEEAALLSKNEKSMPKVTNIEGDESPLHLFMDKFGDEDNNEGNDEKNALRNDLKPQMDQNSSDDVITLSGLLRADNNGSNFLES